MSLSFNLKNAVDTFNSSHFPKYDPKKAFKAPYRYDELIQLKDELEGTFMGWSFIKIRQNLIVNENAPILLEQDRVKKLHTPMEFERFWNEKLNKGFKVYPHLVENAIDILVHPEHIAAELLSKDPDMVYFPTAIFHWYEDSYMILANGYFRMISAWALYDDIKTGFNGDHLEHILWLAKFYDYGGHKEYSLLSLIYQFHRKVSYASAVG